MNRRNSKTEIIIVRTHFSNAALDTFLRELASSSGREVVVVADETMQQVILPKEFRKLTAVPSRLGLHATNDMMWRCGDYFLYEALDRLPHIAFFWMIEPDLRIHTANMKAFFDGTGAAASADFITPWFIPGDPKWHWFRTIAPFAPAVYNCMLQICRLSRGALEYLLVERQRLSSMFVEASYSATDWPNDEAFVASFLHAGGFRICTLSQHAPSFNTVGTLTFTRPFSMRSMSHRTGEDAIYHPVVAGEAFGIRAAAYLLERDAQDATIEELQSEFGFGFQHEVYLEGGAPMLRSFRQQLKTCIERRRTKGS